MSLIIKSLCAFQRRVWNNRSMVTDFFYFNAFRWLSHWNLKIFIELLPQMKDFLELIGSERPNLSDPQWLRRLYILVNMTRRLSTLNLRLQGNKRALLICSKHDYSDYMWTCGLSRWQLGMVLTPHAWTFRAQNIQKFWRITELIDGNNTIILEEIHRVYWRQINLMSVAVFRGNVQMCLNQQMSALSASLNFTRKGCVDCAHLMISYLWKCNLNATSVHLVKFLILLWKHISCCHEWCWCSGQILLTRTVVPIL